MELRSNQLPADDPRHKMDVARAAKQGMEQSIDRMSSAREARASALQAALERVNRVRDAHASQVAELRQRNQAYRARLRDNLELSEAVKMFADDQDQAERVRDELVQSLKAAYQQGNLNTQERIEGAARALLGEEE